MSLPAYHPVAPGQNPAGPVLSDPWESASIDFEKRDSWLLSYIDILTLFLTLFVMLLVLEPKGDDALIDPTPAKTTISEEPVVLRPALQPTTLTEETVAELTTKIAVSENDIGNISDQEVAKDLDLQQFIESPLEDARLQESGAVEDEGLRDGPEPETHESPQETRKEIIAERVEHEPEPEPPPTAAEQMVATLDAEGLGDRLQISAVTEGVQLEMRDSILFATGNADLTMEGRILLNELARVLLGHEGSISIEGHTDSTPIASDRFPSNWELSSNRATVVARYLIENGLSPGQLRAIGYADTRPLDRNDSTEGRARNRRVSLIAHFP